MTAGKAVQIDHARIVDGFGEMRAHSVYRPLRTYCGVCDSQVELSPATQKYMLEVVGVPVKMLRRGAVFCVPCRKRRSRITWLESGDRWRGCPEWQSELRLLRSEERTLKAQSERRYETAPWPYGTVRDRLTR